MHFSRIFRVGAIKIKDQLLPFVEENIAKTRKTFILGVNRPYDHEHFVTSRSEIKYSNNFIPPS